MVTYNGVYRTDRAQIAVIGCGAWGRHLIRNLMQMECLAAICDIDAQVLEACRSTAGERQATTDVARVLNLPNVKGVIIATPCETHGDLVRQALEAGKDVLVEGPLAGTLEETESLKLLAERLGRVLMVGNVLNYHPAMQKLVELVRAGELGDLHYIYSNRLNFGNAFPAANALQAVVAQDLAVLLRLAGRAPESVTCSGGSYLEPLLTDVTVTNLEFGDQLRGHVFASWLHPFKEHRLVVAGTHRMAVFDDLSCSNKLVLCDQGIDEQPQGRVLRRGQSTVVPYEPAEPLWHQCRHFLECIRTRRQPDTDARLAVEVQCILKACAKSLNNRGGPVRLAVAAGV